MRVIGPEITNKVKIIIIIIFVTCLIGSKDFAAYKKPCCKLDEATTN